MKRSAVQFTESVDNFVSQKRQKTDDRQKKLRHSNWMITINPNVPLKTDSQLQKAKSSGTIPTDLNLEAAIDWFAEKLTQVITRIFCKENLSSYLKFRVNGHSYNSVYFRNIDVKHAVEIGERFGRVHSHSMVKIAHFSVIKIDYNYIIQAVNELMGIDSSHVHMALYRNANDTIGDYLEKSGRSDLK